MNTKKRILALALVLCMVIPMCLIQVSAAEAKTGANYDFFHESLKDQNYDAKGGISFGKYGSLLQELYNQGQMQAIPLYVKSKSSAYIQCEEKATDGKYVYDGFRQLKTNLGDWVAIKFRSPGEGYFSISFKHFYLNANNCAAITGYLLPGNTAKENIDSLLTKERELGTVDILSTTTANMVHSLCLTTGAELQANQEYMLVLKTVQDHHNPDDNRLDFQLVGLEFGEGYEPGEGAFNPIRGEVLSEETVKIVQFYRAHSGVNPANGHDMLYLMIKGGDMLVYDIDEDKIVDTKNDIHRQQKGSLIDPEGNLWICGSSNLIYKYNPATKESTKYKWDLSLVDGHQVESYGIVYGDDGYLYFGYYGWLLRMDPKTGATERISDRLTTDPNLESDAQFSGHGGIIYKDGFLYLSLHGDMNNDLITTSQIIKYDIANRKIVDYVDVRDATCGEKNSQHYGVSYLNYIDGILYANFSGRSDAKVYIDITGDKMVRLDRVEGLENELIGVFTDEINGKYYVGGYVDDKESTKCLYEYDPATKTFSRVSEIVFLSALGARGAVVSVDAEGLPGLSLVAASNNTATGMIDVYFYNLESYETVVRSGISMGYGTGVNLNALETDPTGRYLYTGGYGANLLGIYDTQTGEVEMYPTHHHQVDSMIWYDGYLWVGNYSVGTITRYDTEYNDAFPLFEMMSTVFQQVRMLNPTAGDGKVFFAGEPNTARYGGVLAWFDIQNELIYIAAGPNPDEVYYTKAFTSFQVWRNAVTHEIETFDVDGDGMYDYDFIVDDKGDSDPNNDVKKQRFYGVVPNRLIAKMHYVDGYIVGTTAKNNGKTVYATDGNAQIFMYDVKNMKLLSTYDITQTIQGLEDPEDGDIGVIDTVAPDPYEKGKYWGVAVDTLFSFTYDFAANTFNVKEEVSWQKGMAHKPHGTKQGTDILFDGDYMYVSTQHMGTYMVNTADPTVNYQLSGTGTAEMLQKEDGNIYYLSMRDGANSDIKVFRCAEVTQPVVLRSVQLLIDALPDAMNAENEEQFMTVYRMYMDLIETTKAKVNAEKLLTAMGAFETEQVAKAEALIDAIGTVTLESENAIVAARRYYDSLSESAKAAVTKLSVLEAAEETLNQLKLDAMKPAPKPTVTENKDGGNNTILFIAIGAAALIAVAVAVAVILRKKKAQAE